MHGDRPARSTRHLIAAPLIWLLAAAGVLHADGHADPGTPLGETPPGPELPEWNRAEVEVLANSIRDALGAALEAAPQALPQATALQQRTRDAAVSELRRVHVQATDYAKKIREGWSREQSRAWFDLVREGYADAMEVAGDAVASPGSRDHLALVEAQLERLARYYDAL